MASPGAAHPPPDPELAQALIDFMSNEEWDLLLADVNGRIQAMEALPDGAAKTAVFELLQGIDAIHREALRRLVRLFKEGVLEKVVSDPAIHTLMELYDLLPAEVPAPGSTKHGFPTIPIQAVPAGPAPRTRYPHWVPVLQRLEELPPETTREYPVDGAPVLLARHGDRVFALASRCAQDDSSLAGAALSAFTLACPNHPGCYYDIRQGSRIGSTDAIDCYPVKRDELGRLLVGLDMEFKPELPSF